MIFIYSITEPIRTLKKPLRFYEAFCERIDLHRQRLYCRNAVPLKETSRPIFEVPYDRLVIACGARSNTFGIKGVAEHAYFLKEIEDARNIRKRVLDCFEWVEQPNISPQERSRWLHFAIVGGGPTGVEFSAELHDFVKHDVGRLYPRLKDQVTITVYDVADKILGSFDQSLRDYATQKFLRSGIQIRTGAVVEEILNDRLRLQGGEEVYAGMVIWTTGLTANPLVQTLQNVQKDRQNRLMTDPYCRLMRADSDQGVFEHVFAIGDCATSKEIIYSQTAQVASQQGFYVADQLNRRKNYHRVFVYKHMGTLAYLGDHKAIFDSPGHYKKKGRLAWLIWRSAYFSMTVSWKNKLLIPAYWFLTWLFGRDTSRF
jgi:NADH dehydrogenase FAD-containing subunit